MKVWLKQLEKSIKPINRYCLICFNENRNFFVSNICSNCLKEMNPSFTRLSINDVKGIGIYPYNEFIRNLLYKFKGCYDYELRNVFINQYKVLFNVLFHNYVIVYVPSFVEKDRKRGFNHIKAVFDCLSLEKVNCFIKIKDVKQSLLNKEERKKIKKYILLNDNKEKLLNRNVLIVDDVLTTGETMKACINLLKGVKVKKIKFVVLSYNCRKVS